MAASSLQPVVAHIRHLAKVEQVREQTDGHLLRAYLSSGDELAFTHLVRRHAPMVWSVCRRVLRHTQDAEDAFQATFLILARQARSVRNTEAVASWLHGVAYRTATRARRAVCRRRKYEHQATPPQPANPACSATGQEFLALLDAEIERIPDPFRLPFVLCCLENRCSSEVARELGVKVGTVWSRVARARKRLQQRLSGRGLSLAALPAASTLAENATRSTVPPFIISSTIKGALSFAAANARTSGPMSAQAVTLATGVLQKMFLVKLKIAVAVVLTLGMAIGAGWFTCRLLAAAPAEEQQQVDAPKQDHDKELASAANTRPSKETQGERIVVTGRVLNPEGKPVAGAHLHLVGTKWSKAQAVATADGAGEFRVVAELDKVGFDGRLVAVREGYAPDWLDLARCAKGHVTLRLRQDDIPFVGRVLTLEGRPVVGAIAVVERLGQPADGQDIKPWIDKNVKLRAESIWLNERGLVTVTPSAFGMPLSATTDQDGKFRLSGTGRDRVLAVYLRGQGVEHKRFWGITRRDAPKGGYIQRPDMNYSVNGAEVTVLLGPSKPILGTVRDRATGLAIAGITIEDVGGLVARAVTDDKGLYRLEGVAKQQQYHLTAAGQKGVPYFDTTQFGIPDTPELSPITVDFTMDRGLEVTGRVTDKNTGLPVAGEVVYHPAEDNPHLKELPSLKKDVPRVITSKWGRVDPTGTFRLLVIPGRGVLCVCATPHDRYPIRDAGKELWQLKVWSTPAAPVHSIRAIEVDAKQPASLTCNFKLSAGRSRKGKLLGSDGLPLEGVQVAGLRVAEKPQTIKSSDFMVSGLSDRKRLLVAIQPEKKLGGVTEVRGDTDLPFAVKLQPLGSITGRVLDTDGKPLAALQVTLRPARTFQDYDNLPTEWFTFQGVTGGCSALWPEFTGRKAVTDKDGRFHLDRVLPGIDFELYICDGDLAKDQTLVARRNRIRLQTGNALDVGTLKKGNGAN